MCPQRDRGARRHHPAHPPTRYNRPMKFRVLALFLTLCLAATGLAQTFSGKVVAVADGDTISVMRDGKVVKIRLHGIDAPESHQAFGTKSKQFVSDMVFGQTVRVEARSTVYDKYGRFIGEVFTKGGQSLNHESVRAGMSWWYRQYAPKDTTLQKLESEARAAKRGLWSEPNPVAPWDFRHGMPSSQPAKKPNSSAKQGASSSLSKQEAVATVYVTRTGSKYHRDGCRYLRSSRIRMNKKSARSGGYSPCSVCNP